MVAAVVVVSRRKALLQAHLKGVLRAWRDGPATEAYLVACEYLCMCVRACVRVCVCVCLSVCLCNLCTHQLTATQSTFAVPDKQTAAISTDEGCQCAYKGRSNEVCVCLCVYRAPTDRVARLDSAISTGGGSIDTPTHQPSAAVAGLHTKPKKQQGAKVVSLNPTEMFTHLQQFKKVRRSCYVVSVGLCVTPACQDACLHCRSNAVPSLMPNDERIV